MKPDDIVTVINIDHEWMIWTPKRGPYAGMTKYICLLVSKQTWYAEDYIQCIIAGFKKEDKNKPHLSLGSITTHQLENDTKPLNDWAIQELFEKMFKEYKKLWQEKQVVKKTKAFLINK